MIDVVTGGKSRRKGGEETRNGVVVLAVAVTPEEQVLRGQMIVETNIEVIVVSDVVADDEVIIDYASRVGQIEGIEIVDRGGVLSSGGNVIRDASGVELRAGRWIENRSGVG